MKNLVFLFLVLLIIPAAHAQQKFSTSFFAMPTFDYNTSMVYYTAPPPNGSTYDLKQPYGITLGLNGNFFLSKKLWISTGLWYSKVIERNRNINTFDFYGNRLPVYHSAITYDAAKIPVLLYGQIGNKRLSFIGSAGVLLGYTFREKTVIDFKESSIAYPDEKRSRRENLYYGFLLSMNLSAGVMYKLSDKIALTAEPNVALPIKHMHGFSEGIKWKDPHSIGLRFGIMFNLR